MASSVIHIAVENEINKSIKKDKVKLLIGTIAPDISKRIRETKEKSHFLDSLDNDIPNLDKFLNKYKNNLDLKIFYNTLLNINNIIEEIPMDKLQIIIDAAIEIIENTKMHKDMVFDINNINQFIKTSSELILSELEKLNI